MIKKVICISNSGFKELLTVGKIYEGIIYHGFYRNFIKVNHDKNYETYFNTEYFKFEYKRGLKNDP